MKRTVGPRNEMGSDPRFVSGVVCQAVRPLFHWDFVQSETKRVFFTVSLRKRGTSPPRIRFQPGGTRKINGLGAEAHPVSHLVALANETDRSTPSSHDHPSASHSPCDLGAKLHSPQKKGIPSGVSPKIVSLVRKGLTDQIYCFFLRLSQQKHLVFKGDGLSLARGMRLSLINI